MTRSEVLSRIEVGKHDFVVDVGGGHRPFHRADLVIERYPFDRDLHRDHPVRFPSVPLIKADAMALPISDQGCDLIFASHIIEHLPDPGRFLTEIKRCSRHVYLEFPSRKRELMYAWSFHEWLIDFNGGVLRFYRNDLPQMFGGFFHEEYDAALGAWSEARHEYLNTSIYCRSDELQCEFPTATATEWILSDSLRGDAKLNSSSITHRPHYSLRENLAFFAQSVLPVSIYSNLSRKREKTSAPAPLPDSTLARIACLRCRATKLNRAGAVIKCPCGAKYSQDRGVFDFDVNFD